MGTTSAEEYALIVKIMDRAIATGLSEKNLFMDICCVHETIGLDLEGLLAAKGGDFSHDVCGIVNRLDRTTKKLESDWLPRYAKVIEKPKLFQVLNTGGYAAGCDLNPLALYGSTNDCDTYMNYLIDECGFFRENFTVAEITDISQIKQ